MTTNEFLDNIQSSFPHIYNVYDHNTILYALLSVYASKFGAKEDIINRVYAMIGIDSTYDEDLEHRWGSLLGIYKNNGESFRDYRARLMIVYASLTGGTEEAIKYAVASTVGISSDQDMINEYIHIYDAWTYYDSDIKPNPTDPRFDPLTNSAINKTNSEFVLNKPYDIHKYGAFVCTIDLTVDENIVTYYDKIIWAINQTKASGIAAYLVLLYITNELCVVHMNESDKMKVSELLSDAGRIVTYRRPYYPSLNSEHTTNIDFVLNDRLAHFDFNVDEYKDVIRQSLSDTGRITSKKSFVWKLEIGKTNTTMITCQTVDTDGKYDIVRFMPAYDNPILSSIEIDKMSITKYDGHDIGNQHSADTDSIIANVLNTESGSMTRIKSHELNAGTNDKYSLNHNLDTNATTDTDEDSMIVNYADSIDTDNAHVNEYLIGSMIKNDNDHGHMPSAKRVFNPILNCGVMLNGNFVTNRLSEFADVDDKLMDKANQTIQEKGTCTVVTTKTWYPLIGIHTDVILNTDFRTNMLLETDMCKDVIKQI